MKKLVMAVFLFVPSLSYADIITFDYSGIAPASYTIPYSSTGPVSYSADYGNFVYAFQDSGVTFLNARLTTSPYASDGHTMSDAGAAQYGTLGILFSTPVTYAAIQFAQPGDVFVLPLDFDGSGNLLASGSYSGGLGASTLDVSSASAFNFLSLQTNGDQVDTLFFNPDPPSAVPEPPASLLFASGLMGLIGLGLMPPVRKAFAPRG